MRVGHSYKQVELRGPFDAIVVGSGIGGLVCASLLARRGDKRVLVLERHYTAGGFTHSFERPGYDWDVGVHYIGQVLDGGSPLRRLFDLVTDGELAWADLGDVYDEIHIGDDRYAFMKGRDAFRARMHGYFPNERKTIDAYLDLTRRIARYTELFFADRAMPKPLASVIGPLLRAPVSRDAERTTAAAFASLGASRRLMAVLTGNFGDYGLPPSQSSFFMQALLAEHYREGAAYPVGGASRIAATIVPGIERAGGAVVTSAPVSTILVENERAVGVRLENGDEWRAPIIVSDAGARITFERLLPPEIATRLGVGEALREISASVASVTLYLGLEGSAQELELPKQNLWLYDHDDHDRAFHYVTGHESLPNRSAGLPVAFCSSAAARDPMFEKRHPGRSTAEIITVSDHRWFRAWSGSSWQKRGEEYESIKTEWSERLLEPLVRRVPQIRDRIRHMELSTPLTTQHFASHPHGEIYGLAHTPRRFRERTLRADTPIRGLYLAGSDVVTCGVAGGASGGMICAMRILAEDVRRLFRGRQPERQAGYVSRVQAQERAAEANPE